LDKYNNDTIAYFPLSQPQERIWYTQNIYPDSPMYFLGGWVEIDGIIDFTILKKAILMFINGYDSFSIRFKYVKNEIKLYFSDVQYDYVDMIEIPQNESIEAFIQSRMQKYIGSVVSLIDSPLFKVGMFNKGRKSGYMLFAHHLISDGWSMQLFTKGIQNYYEKLSACPNGMTDHMPAYQEYLSEEKEYLLSEKATVDGTFWRGQFTPEDLIVTDGSNLKGERQSFLFSKNETDIINELMNKYHCSLNSVFIVLYMIFLYLVRNQNESIIGNPVLGRSNKKQRGIFGMFTGTMPIRCRIDPSKTAGEMMQIIYRQTLSFFKHQKYPYNQLIQSLRTDGRYGDALFDVCINTYHTEMAGAIGGYACSTHEVYNGEQLYGMQMIIRCWDRQKNIQIDVDYKAVGYTDEIVNGMVNSIRTILLQIHHKPNECIANLSAMDGDEEKKLVLDFNATQTIYKKATVVDLLEEQVKKSPEATALEGKNRSVTYKQFWERVHILASELVDMGMSRGDKVIILAHHSVEMVTAVYAVLVAGGIYIPIDPSYPKKRIQLIANQVQAYLVITDTPDLALWLNTGLVISLGDVDWCKHITYNNDVKPSCEDISYIIFTSGSSGTPKGVVITHDALSNYILWASDQYNVGSQDVFALYTSISFDLTVTSLFVPLISGGKVKIYPADRSDALLDILNENICTVIKLTPAHLMILAESSLEGSALRCLILGGDKLPTSAASKVERKFGKLIDLYNEYGPTEATVGCMIYKYNADTDNGVSVPIGKPVANMKIYILNEGLRPVPEGEVGEIYIAGTGLAKGYFNDDVLTSEKFIFWNNQRVYKTGDNAKFIRKDCIEYIGRKDEQVKIKGFRIDLNEVKRAILRLSGVTGAEVCILTSGADTQQLVAYLVSDVEESAVIEELRQILPRYMIPSVYIYLDKFPLTLNGKIDRRALPNPAKEVTINEQSLDEEQQILLKVIAEVLNFKNQISLQDNFIKLGGDSIKAILLSMRIKENNYELAVKDILQAENFLQISRKMKKLTDRGQAYQLHGLDIHLTPIHRWFFNRDLINRNYYNHCIYFSVDDIVPYSMLCECIQQIYDVHNELRINYSEDKGVLFYNDDHIARSIAAKLYDFTADTVDKAYEQMHVSIRDNELNFDISSSLLFCCMYFKFPNHQNILVFLSHHLLVDGVSWQIIIRDMEYLLAGKVAGQKPVLQVPLCSYQEWALNGMRSVEYFKGETEYWRNIQFEIKQLCASILLPVPTNTSSSMMSLDSSETTLLTREANIPYQTNEKELILTSLIAGLRDWNRDIPLCFEVEIMGREDGGKELDVTRTLGWFTAMFPICVKNFPPDISDRLIQTKKVLRDVPGNGVHYGLLRYEKKALENIPSEYLIRYNYLGNLDYVDTNKYLNLNDFEFRCDPNEKTDCLIECDAFIIKESFQIRLRSSYYTKNQLDDLNEAIKTQLIKIIHHCVKEKEIHYIPSDFSNIDISQEDLDILSHL